MKIKTFKSSFFLMTIVFSLRWYYAYLVFHYYRGRVRMKVKILLSVLLVFLLSLLSFSQNASRPVPPPGPTYNWSFSLIQPTPSETLSYSDAFIKITFGIDNQIIGFEIQNKTDSGIKINWDDLSIIYPSGTFSRVICLGKKPMDKNSPQAPTVVPPNAKVQDALIPSENIYRDNLDRNGVPPLFGGDDILKWNNKDFRIYFPLEIKGSKKEYTFKFKIHVSEIVK